ncbi:MAG: YgiT-type zinc finger protein [Candidatus Wallbacteria bacterium]|nr:YgiT-type zinc finger protein [Candidatus Wallbacteria bacterium]
MSSQSTNPTSKGICPECGKGKLFQVVASRTYEVDGQRVRVDGLLPWECETCHKRVWPNAEVQRARQIIAFKLHKAAA